MTAGARPVIDGEGEMQDLVAARSIPSTVKLRAASIRSAYRVINPMRVFAWTFGIYGAGLFIAPMVPEISVNWIAASFWVAVAVWSLIGASAIAPSRPPSRHELLAIGGFNAAQLARRCIGIGAIGVVLSVFDRYVVRGAPLSINFFEVRDVVTEAGSGFVSIVAAATSSFAAFGLITAWLARSVGKPVSRGLEVIAAFALILYLFLSISLGSRSLMLVCVLIHLLAAIFFRILRHGRLGWKLAIGVAFSLLLAVGASVWVLLERLDQMGLSPLDSIELSGYTYTLKPAPYILNVLDGDSQLGYVAAAAYSLLLYVYHGFYEFCLLFDNFASPHLLGAQDLWLPLKLIGLVTGSDLAVDPDALIGFRDGVYTTFAGPLFLDFGWFAPLSAFFIFLLLGYPFRRVATGDLRWLPAAIQVAAIIILAPVVSLLDSSVGTFLLLASVALPLLTRRTR